MRQSELPPSCISTENGTPSALRVCFHDSFVSLVDVAVLRAQFFDLFNQKFSEIFHSYFFTGGIVSENRPPATGVRKTDLGLFWPALISINHHWLGRISYKVGRDSAAAALKAIACRSVVAGGRSDPGILVRSLARYYITI